MKSRQTLAFVFPGQGSQSVGMLRDLAAEHPQLVDTFNEASSVLGRDLWDLVCHGPAETLGQTELTQPLMLTSGFALWRLWATMTDERPGIVAGHSLGEYTALVAAGSLEFSTALRVVAERGRLMQAAVPAGHGAMAAILGLADETVEAICREVAEQQVVAAANYNSPGQIVIAGESAAVERAMRACRDAGARRTLKLPVSAPSHCRLMAPAVEPMRRLLSDIQVQDPQIPVLHNADLRVHHSADDIRAALVAQLCAPVRWTDTIHGMRARGVAVVVECGPGRVLTTLGKRIDRSLHWVSIDTPSGLDELRGLDFSGETTSI